MRQLIELGQVAQERAFRRFSALFPCGAQALVGACAALWGSDRGALVRTFVEPASGRPYRVVMRAGQDPTHLRAALFALHAYATPPDVLVEGYGLIRHAVLKRDWLLVIPEGRLDATARYHWNAAPACCGVGERHDDLAYLRDVLRDVSRHLAVDAQRVFALGVSNGGFMAHRWACAGQGDLAGIISIAGAAAHAAGESCMGAPPLSVLHVHGTEDDVVHYEGQYPPSHPYASAPASVAPWRIRAGAAATPVVRQRRSLALEPIRVETWASQSARISLWSVAGGTHQLRAIRYFVPEFLDFIAGVGAAETLDQDRGTKLR